ncbi:MAG: hypothetical protein LBQ79_02875 [Deltaproteobacteria bacterium]|jgi:pentatricopeptide repeat protein|nr:hypothetical protein [Deltaproteobacteria bacterium]
MTSRPTSDSEILGRTLDALLDEAAGLCPDGDEGADGAARRRARASMTLLRARDAYERLDAAGPREGDKEERDFIKRGARLVAANARCGFTAEADTLYSALLARCEAFKRGEPRLPPVELYRALALTRAARRLSAAFQRQGLPEDADRIYFSMELLAHGEGALAEIAYCASYLVLEAVQAQDRERSLGIFSLLKRIAVPPPKRPGHGRARLTLVDGDGGLPPDGEDGPDGTSAGAGSGAGTRSGNAGRDGPAPPAGISLAPDMAVGAEDAAEGGAPGPRACGADSGADGVAVSGAEMTDPEAVPGGTAAPADVPDPEGATAREGGGPGADAASGDAWFRYLCADPHLDVDTGEDGGPAGTGKEGGPSGDGGAPVAGNGDGSAAPGGAQCPSIRLASPQGTPGGEPGMGADGSGPSGAGGAPESSAVYGGPGTSGASPSAGASAGDGPAAAGRGPGNGRGESAGRGRGCPEKTRSPLLTLVAALGGPGDGPDFPEGEGDGERGTHPGEEFWLVEAQTAVNLISGYAFAGDPGEAREVYDSLEALPDSSAMNAYRAIAAVNMICSYGSSRRFAEAAEVWRSMDALGEGPEFTSARAKAAVNLVNHYGDAGRIDDALAVFASMDALGDDPATDVKRAEALSILVYACGDRGRFEEAKELFGRLGASYGDGPEVNRIRAQAAINLICDSCIAKDLEGAKAIFEGMDAYGDGEWHAAKKAKALYNLVTGLTRAGDVKGALRYFRTMDSLGYPERIGPEKARTSFHLMTELGLHGMLDEAFEVYDGLRRLGNADGAALERSKACVNLVGFLGCAGRLTEARELYREMLSEEGRPPEADVNLAKCAFNLVYDFGKTRDFASAADVLAGMGMLGDRDEIAAERALAGYRLILFLVEDGRSSEALAVLEGMESLGSSEKVLLGRARGTVALVQELGAAGRIGEAKSLYGAMRAFGGGRRMRAERARAGFRLCSAALKCGDPETAEAAFASMKLLGDDDDTVLTEIGRACVNMASHYCSRQELDDARRVVSEARGLPDRGVIPVLKGKAAFNLVTELSRAGLMDEARELWLDGGLFPPAEELLVPRARLGVVLVRNLAASGRFVEAGELLRAMDALGSSRAVESLRETALFELDLARGARREHPFLTGLVKSLNRPE